MYKRLIFFISCIIIFSSNFAYACVGKTIFIGHLNNIESELVGNILSKLITERTGTSVKLKKFSSSEELLQAGTNGDIDLFVFDNYEVQKIIHLAEFDKARTEFNTKFNLVFLKPLIETKNTYSVPIIRKDTLKKFPALPRLIEKLNGILIPATINELIKELNKKPMKDIVRDFLKGKNLF